MREKMKQLFAGEDAVAVQDQPDVQATHQAFDEARQSYEAIRLKVAELDRLCAPVVDSSDRTPPPDRLMVLQAQAKLPALRLELWEREAALDTARKAHLHAVAEAVKQLEAARSEPRRALVRRLFDALDEAKVLAEQVEAFDLETRALGGTPPSHPFSELIDEPYRPGMVSFRRAMFMREGAL